MNKWHLIREKTVAEAIAKTKPKLQLAHKPTKCYQNNAHIGTIGSSNAKFQATTSSKIRRTVIYEPNSVPNWSAQHCPRQLVT